MFKILSLDGGGIRGAFIAAFLARIQQNLPRPLIEYFDLIAGTSTGGLIAVALGMGLSPEQIKEFYRLDGPRIFTRPPFRMPGWKRRIVRTFVRKFASGIDAEWIARPKYESTPLRNAIQKHLQERLFGEARIRLAIPSVDLIAGRGVVFKTPHRPNFVRDRRLRATDIIMATTAAPSYFSPAAITEGSAYCDGGIWANNPAVVGYVEAVRISQECTRPNIDPVFASTEIKLLSIGTGTRRSFARPVGANSGLQWWAPRLLSISGETQSEGIHNQAQYLLGPRYMRIDFEIPEEKWELDSVENLDSLMHLGDDHAVNRFSDLRIEFLDECAVRYTPFDI